MPSRCQTCADCQWHNGTGTVYCNRIDLSFSAQYTKLERRIHKLFVLFFSAGCGRTGTICAIDFAWDMLKMGVRIKIMVYDTTFNQG